MRKFWNNNHLNQVIESIRSEYEIDTLKFKIFIELDGENESQFKVSFIQDVLLDSWRDLNWKNYVTEIYMANKINLKNFKVYRRNLARDSEERILPQKMIRKNRLMVYPYRLFNNLFLKENYRNSVNRLNRPIEKFFIRDRFNDICQPEDTFVNVLFLLKSLFNNGFPHEEIINTKIIIKEILRYLNSRYSNNLVGYFFGGHKEQRNHKDLDIIIVTKEKMSYKEKLVLANEILTINNSPIPLDLFIHNSEEYKYLYKVGFVREKDLEIII